MQVKPIVQDVKERGDAAVKDYTARFDRVDLTSVCTPIEVSVPILATSLDLMQDSCTHLANASVAMNAPHV